MPRTWADWGAAATIAMFGVMVAGPVTGTVQGVYRVAVTAGAELPSVMQAVSNKVTMPYSDDDSVLFCPQLRRPCMILAAEAIDPRKG
jgi:hypothetical protein